MRLAADAGPPGSKEDRDMEFFDFASLRIVFAGLAVAVIALLIGIVGDALAHRIGARRRF